MRDLKSRRNIERLLGSQRPALRRYGAMGPSFFLAAFLLFSALVISYLLPAWEITPQPPQPTASFSAASLPRVAESLLEAVLHPSHR
ncbi:MAG: hypothetical protein V3R47_01825, partial [candidate division NC10 bacterium]